MKAAVCALLLLLALSQAKALKCHSCFSKGGELCESTSIQTCSGSDDACGAVILPKASFRQCINMTVCEGYAQTPGALAHCCSTDLCN
uniref:UPAR/Ly6 domain-containing protein n=1 Tax=Hippocampus comes TaxID=109280 RepID=A0A3Q2ZKQ2_HIPCM